MKKILVLLIGVFFFSISYSQIKFFKSVISPNSGLDGVNTTKDGGYIACGRIQTTSAINYDFMVIKVDTMGWSNSCKIG